MNKFLQYTAITMVALTLCISVSAQALRTAYFMENSTVRSSMNPALMPNRGYFSIPFIGSINTAYTSNSLSVDNILYPNPSGSGLVTFLDESVDTRKFLSDLKDNNTLDVDCGVNLISFGFYGGKGFWTVDMNLKTSANVGLPKNFFEFAKLGSGSQGSVYDLRDMRINMNVYQDFALGYARPINDRLTIGARVKFIAGLANADIVFDRMHIKMNDSEWSIDAQGTFNASIAGIEAKTKTDDEGRPTDILDLGELDIDKFGVGGYGFGVDLGATYKVLDNLTVSAGVVDLGLINWSSKSNISGVSNGKYNFAGFNIVDGVEQGATNFDDFDEITNFHTAPSKSRTTSLRTTINLGGEYTILDNLLGFGLLSSTQVRATKSYSELTASANVRPIGWFSAAVSYSMLHSGFKTVGLAVNFHPSWINFFLGTDYMIGRVSKQFIPISQKAANFYFGLAIPMGRKPDIR